VPDVTVDAPTELMEVIAGRLQEGLKGLRKP
jgi:hypothetical protein